MFLLHCTKCLLIIKKEYKWFDGDSCDANITFTVYSLEEQKNFIHELKVEDTALNKRTLKLVYL